MKNPLINEKALRILSALKTKKANFTELLKEVGGSTTTVQVYTKKLLKSGHIREEKMGGFPFRRTFKITKKGLKTLLLLESLG